jgi:taurine dioxygenase
MHHVSGMAIRELKPGFGAEVSHIDLATCAEADLDAVAGIFNRHSAVLVRDQVLSPDDLIRFISHFGEPEGHVLRQYTLPGYPCIFILSNKLVDGKPIGAHNDGIGWHTDTPYKAAPVTCTMLYAVEVPPEGSDTLLADMCAAYENLSAERQRQLDPLVLHHSYQYFMENRDYVRVELSPELKAANPDVFHPLVRVHPTTGRRALWACTGTVKEVVGLPTPEGLGLVDELVDFITQDRFVYRHRWRVGDVLVWDNRSTLHTGTLFDDTKYDRLMYRLWVKGERPRGVTAEA